jgi:hypothetical protein
VGQIQTHQIRVDTEEDLVTVQIGGEGSVPGGFAKFFNRVIDSEAWARLSDAGRAAYMPLVRFADHRNQYRVQIGQAALMKYSGLSRSSAKRAIKDLLTSKLIVLVEQGGVTADGRNESNLYQLMVPIDPKPRMTVGSPSADGQADNLGYAARETHFPASSYAPPATARRMDRAEPIGASPAAGRTPFDPPVGPGTNPPGVRQRTPSRFSAEPPVGPALDPAPVPPRTATPVHGTPQGGFASGPQLRSISDLKDSSRIAAAPQLVVAAHSTTSTDAAALLEENGVEPSAARQLALTHPLQRVLDVIDTMKFRQARGKCDNPGGFIRDALVKQWQTPQAVLDARAKAEARSRAEAAEREARHHARRAEATQAAYVDADQRRIDQVVDALDDDELGLLADEVLKKYDGNTAVLAVLTRKPARQCRLMRMEVAAMLTRR